jgi:hypothetical protein
MTFGSQNVSGTRIEADPCFDIPAAIYPDILISVNEFYRAISIESKDAFSTSFQFH